MTTALLPLFLSVLTAPQPVDGTVVMRNTGAGIAHRLPV
jgi:hypothetical protein